MKQDHRKTARPAEATAEAHTATRRRGRRVLVAMLAPLLFLGFVEAALRVSGFGHPVSFLLPESLNGQAMLLPNYRFTWRFFGPEQSREPALFAIPDPKPEDTVRVFVFGESAAFGDPQPEFGLARMLEALLSLRYPDRRFEVVNAAITAINSHVVLPIARDCGAADGDVWVLYLGNNEVIGPFGAGTVFGPQAPPLPLIRSSLALKATRTGQWLDAASQRFQRRPEDKQEWGGMLMFVENQVRSEDPRMEAVYHHFERNMADILDAAERSGVGVVASSVAVNLRDCAPFASASRPGLGESAALALQAHTKSGREALERGAYPEALSFLQQAAGIDATFAEVQFLLGHCLLALGDAAQARAHFVRARDEDTLRFRCDTVLNETIRRLARERSGRGVAFVDSAAVLAQRTPDHTPGRELFYDHVHLTFDGNYLVALTIAEAVAGMLPPPVQAPSRDSASWPSMAACAERLAHTDRARTAAASAMLGRLRDPPFSSQWNHQEQVDHLQAIALHPSSDASPAGLLGAIAATRRALQARPEDALLRQQLAGLLEESGALAEAESVALQTAALLPHSPSVWYLLGRIRAKQQMHDSAIEAFENAVRGDAEDAWAHYFIALAFAESGRRDEAEKGYRRAISIKPHFGPAYLGLGLLYDAEGRSDEADTHIREALVNRVLRPDLLSQLAEVCRQRRWYEEALTNYVDAMGLNPADPALPVGAGQCLEALGRSDEAIPYYEQAARVAPNDGRARFLLGLALGREGDTDGALPHFTEAARLMPSIPEAHLNLGVAQLRAGQGADALRSFQQVLWLQPENQLAQQQVRSLQARAAATSGSDDERR